MNKKISDQTPISQFKLEELELVQKMYEDAPFLMCVFSGPEHRIMYINKLLRGLAGIENNFKGVSAEELLRSVKVPEKQLAERLEDQNQAYNSGETIVRNELKIHFDRNNSGRPEEAFFNVVYQPLEDTNGQIYGIFFTGFEVTEQIRVREQIKHSEKRLALILESASMGLWEVNVINRTMDFITDQTKLHFGYSLEEDVSYDKFLSTIHPEDRKTLRAKAENALIESDGYYEIEYRVVWRDGSEHWLMSRGQWIFNQEGMPYKQIGLTLEITEQKYAEQMLEEAIKLRDEFLSIASHELQTPVTSIKANTELFERRLVHDGEIQFAKQAAGINKRIDQLSRLTHNLLDVSSIREGNLKLEKEYFSLRQLVSETIETLQHISNHSYEVHCPKQTEVYADRFRVGQVLTNLMNNAARYSWDSDRIIVNVSMESNFVCISITDFGIGVEDHEKEKIFDRFYKGGNDNKANQPGFGIGLYISGQIVQRHGGRIWVEDNPAGGSVFNFTLPVSGSN